MSPLTFWRITCTFAQEVLFNQAFPSVSIGKHTLLNAYRVAGFLHPTPARLSLQKNRPNPCKERTWRACVLFCHPVFPVFIGICIAFIVRGEKNTDSISQNWNTLHLFLRGVISIDYEMCEGVGLYVYDNAIAPNPKRNPKPSPSFSLSATYKLLAFWLYIVVCLISY